MKNKKPLNKNQLNTISLIMLILVLSGIFGMIYEILFYRIDLGYFVKRGELIGPWLPIYSFGGLLIYYSTLKYKKKPSLVLLISTVVCGGLEYIVGYLLLHISNIRLWDYNTEILNFGNINGFICLRSILFFGISGLFLIYVIIPAIRKIQSKINTKLFYLISIIPGIIFIIDFIVIKIILKIIN